MENSKGEGGDEEGKHKLLCARDDLLTRKKREREIIDQRVYPSRNFVNSEGREDGKQGS